MTDCDSLKREQQGEAREPRGALALVGLWGDLDDAEIDAFIADIYAQRERDTGRTVELEE